MCAMPAFDLVDESGAGIPGFLAAAKPEALILVHEIFGLTSQIKEVAKRFAAEGFTTFAIDLYNGMITDDEARGIQFAHSIRWKQAMEQVRAVSRALSRLGQGSKVAIAGFSLGGAMALSAASQIPEMAACVTWYGIPTTERGNLLQIACKVQGHFGNLDKQISKDRVDALEARLKSGGVPAEIFRYNTGHFFFNESRKAPVYSAHNAEHSFRRAVAFLKTELSGGW
jgi:carboxymethylenebutenolidase